MVHFQVQKTITGNVIKTRSNKRLRIFTIIKNGIKYKTVPLSKEEFESLENNTGNDWNNFLKYSQDYYPI